MHYLKIGIAVAVSLSISIMILTTAWFHDIQYAMFVLTSVFAVLTPLIFMVTTLSFCKLCKTDES